MSRTAILWYALIAVFLISLNMSIFFSWALVTPLADAERPAYERKHVIWQVVLCGFCGSLIMMGLLAVRSWRRRVQKSSSKLS